ncbi:MAG: DUF4157 domain-containing protein [Lachnospiraceae bacterium]|nr:DUF4157 domain-containing protein [Lachnospiraceae bacterium]
MSKHLFMNEAAEKEANDVAFRFMNSSDVVRDMKRAYSGRLDRVRLHDDASAGAKVSAAGRDGIASGKDIYLKQGLLSDHSPETNGLIAHEMAHTMQQSSDSEGAGMKESVSFGEEQGGIRDWFRKRKMDRMQISEPQGAHAMMGGKKVYFNKDGTYSYNQRDYTGQSLELARDLETATPEQLRSPEMQARAQQDFNSYYTPLFRQAVAKGEDPAFLFRGNGSGALKNFTTVMSAMEPENMAESVLGGLSREEELAIVKQGLDKRDYKGAVRQFQRHGKFLDDETRQAYERGPVESHAKVGEILDLAAENVTGKDGEGTDYGNFLLGAHDAFTNAGIDDDKFSSIMMDLSMLRGGFVAKAGNMEQRITAADDERIGTMAVGRGQLGQMIQKDANEITNDSERSKQSKFGSALARLLKRKREKAAAAPQAAGRARSGTVFTLPSGLGG